MPSTDLEQQRQRFLDQLHARDFDVAGHAAMSAYWQDVAQEAQHIDDLGRVDQWLKELARDKDRLAELRTQQQQAASSQMGAAEAVQLITRLLALLDDVGIKLRRRLAQLREEMDVQILILGMKRKPKPTEEEKDDKKAQQAALAKNPVKAQPTKTKAG